MGKKTRVTSEKTLVRTQERYFCPHHLLLCAANRSQTAAQSLSSEGGRSPGFFFDNLATITFSAFAIEAMCNAFGERLIADWKTHEWKSPVDKLSLVANAAKAPYDSKVEPWASAEWLFELRNKIAHAKPKKLNTVEYLTPQQARAHDFKVVFPKSPLERRISDNNAQRALNVAERIRDILGSKLSHDLRFELAIDGAMGVTKLRD